MNATKTAVLLIGFQNDYFAEDVILHSVIEANASDTGVLKNSVELADGMARAGALVINLPILFSPDYAELKNPAGLLATIKEVGAFRRDTSGGRVSPEIRALGDRVVHLEGKTGFNAFLGTGLAEMLEERGIEEVILAGVVTSVCIDSTGRAAAEKGYAVTVVRDCSAGRSRVEHDFYCDNVFPLYAQVSSLAAVTSRFGVRHAA